MRAVKLLMRYLHGLQVESLIQARCYGLYVSDMACNIDTSRSTLDYLFTFMGIYLMVAKLEKCVALSIIEA